MYSKQGWRSRVLIGVSALCASALSVQACASGTSAAPGKDQSAHAAHGKPGSGVGVAYRIEGTPRAGSPTPIVFTFSRITADDGARVKFGTDAPAQLVGTASLELARGATREARIEFIAPTDGAWSIAVTTTQGGRASVTAVPINVGGVEPKRESIGSPKTMPSGERVISLPAK